MIREDHVSFEAAKLLKEKGFDGTTNCYYFDDSNKRTLLYSPFKENYNDGITNKEFEISSNINSIRISAPTLAMVMKWLREVHNILLVVDYEYEYDSTPYYYKIYRLGINGKPERIAIKGTSYDKDNNPTEHIVSYRDWERSPNDYPLYEEACDAAIKYCLENLI